MSLFIHTVYICVCVFVREICVSLFIHTVCVCLCVLREICMCNITRVRVHACRVCLYMCVCER